MRISKTIVDIRWAFISLTISSAAHFLLRIVLGRELGAYGLGLYTLVFVIYLFGTQFAAFGIGAALTKYVAEFEKNPKKIKEFVSSGLIGSILSGFAIGVTLFLFSEIIAINFFHNPNMTILLRMTALCFPFIAIQKTVIGTLNGLRKMKHFALVNIIQNVSVFFISFSLVIFLNKGIIGAVIGLVFPTIFISIISLFFIRDLLVVPTNLFNIVLKELTIFGVYIVMSNSFVLLNTQIDSLLISHYMSEIQVGYYAIAVIIIQGIWLVPNAIQRVTTPMIASYNGKNDYNNIKKLLKVTMFKTFLITIVLAVLLVIFGKIIISELFGNEFLPAYIPMVILLISYAIYAPFVSVGSTLSSIGKIKIAFRVVVISVIINISLNVILIPNYGIIGAASATSFSRITICIMQIYLFYKYIFK